jgi:hypothetical protein
MCVICPTNLIFFGWMILNIFTEKLLYFSEIMDLNELYQAFWEFDLKICWG